MTPPIPPEIDPVNGNNLPPERIAFGRSIVIP